MFNPEQREPKVEMSESKVQGLIFKSFELSQGVTPLLIAFWSYIHMRFPETRVSAEVMAKIRPNLEQAFQRMLVAGPNNPGVHASVKPENNIPFTAEGVSSSTGIQLDTFEKIINGKSGNNFLDEGIESTLKYIMSLQALIEYIYLVEQNGRPGNPGKKDIWDSDICKYLLSRPPKSTGHKEYDTMFEEIRGFHSSSLASGKYPEIYDKTKRVVEVYNIHHPNEQVTNIS